MAVVSPKNVRIFSPKPICLLVSQDQLDCLEAWEIDIVTSHTIVAPEQAQPLCIPADVGHHIIHPNGTMTTEA